MYILDRENKRYSTTAKNDKPYNLEVCQLLMSKPCTIGDDAKRNALENEKYVKGLQGDGKYKPFFQSNFSKKNNSQYFKADDLDLSPLGLLKLIYRSIYARLNKVEYFSNLELVDEKSTNENKRYLIELETLLELQEPMKEVLGGVDILSQRLKNQSKLQEYTPKTIEELRFYQDIGYKNGIELLLERHIEIINNGNNYAFEVQPMINHNLIISGLCGSHLFLDNNNKVCEEPIHINDIKVIGGTRRNYEDASAYVINKKFTVDSFFEIIKDSLSTTSVDEGGELVQSGNILNDHYEKLRGAADNNGIIDVKLCYWSTADDYSMKVAFNEEKMILRNHNGSAHLKNKVQRWYSAYYVHTIEEVYNYGPMKNMSRKKVNGKFTNAFSPVTLIRGLNSDLSASSPIQPLKKIEDIATILWGKFQNEIARMKPTRTDIDLKAMAETTAILKVVMPDIEVTDVMNALNLGLGLTGSSTIDGKQSNSNTFRTVTYPVEILNSYLQVINMIMDMCFQFAGVPRVDVGVEQNERYSNFVTKMGLQGADKAILELFELKDELIRSNAEKKANMVVRLYQSMDKIKNPYANLFDDYEAKMLADVDFAISREFTVKIEKGFSDEDIAEIKQTIAQLNQRFMQTQGNDGIDFADNLTILEILKDNPKRAKYKIQILLKRKREEAEKRALERQQMNQNMQMQSNQQAQQGEMQLLAMQQQQKKEAEQFAMEFAQMKSQLKQLEDKNRIILESQYDNG